MSRRSRNSVLRFQDALNRLENRRLLAVAFANVDPILKSGDFTGPTSSVGPDGNTDIKISLKDLTAKEVASVLVTAKFSDNSFTYWKYGDNKQGLPYAEFIRQRNTGDSNFPMSVDGTGSGYSAATIYVSPTGGLAIKEITVSVTYINESGTSTETTTPFNTTSLSDLNSIVAETRSKVESLPTYLANAAEFQTNQFNGTEFSTVKKGDFLIKLTSLPSGKSYSDIEAIYLDDGTGAAQGNETKPTIGYGSAVWSSVYGQGSYRLTIDKKSTYADIYAQPIRNELGSTMTMVVKLTGNTYFYTQFEGKAVDETLAGRSNAAWVDGTATTYYVQPMNGTSVGNGAKVTVRTGTTGNFLGDPSNGNAPYDLKYLLSSAGSGVIPTGSRVIFTAASGANEYVIPQSPYSGNHALVLDRPISLEGESGATLKINAETKLVSGNYQVYDDSILISSSHVQIKGLKIDFDKAVYHDADSRIGEKNLRAVIGIVSPNAGASDFKTQLVNIRLVGNEIVGPFTTTENNASASTLQSGTVGIPQESPLIRTKYASGIIEGNIIRGGTVDLELGPWTVVKNSFRGPKGSLLHDSNFDTDGKQIPAYVIDLIKLTSARDVVVESNEAYMPAASGDQKQQRAYRFVLMKNDLGAATNLRIEGNTIGSGIGRRMDDSKNQELSESPASGTYAELTNYPEIILSENYGMNYEGETIKIEADRRILQLPSPETSRRGWSIKAGDVVAILEGPFAGQFRVVAQVFLPGGVNDANWKTTATVLILQEPLPGTEDTMVVSVTQGTKNLDVVENSIDLKNTTSHAIVLSGNEYDVLLKGNTIEGDYKYVTDGNHIYEYQKAMRLEAHSNRKSDPPAAGYVAPNPLPSKHWSRLPMFGLYVVDNVIKNVQGGIIISTADQTGYDTATATSGRVYMSGYVANNRFLGYDTSTSTTATPSMNTRTILTVGNRKTKYVENPTTHVLSEEITYGSANLSNNVVSLNSGGGSSGFLPNSGSGYNLAYFADPFAIRLSMTNNWVNDTSANKRFEYISAVINGDPKVLTDSGSIASLSTLPSVPIYEYVQDENSPNAEKSGTASWTQWTTDGYAKTHSSVYSSGTIDTPTATYKWTFENLDPGIYEVWATWISDQYRATDVPFTIYDGENSLGTVRVNQKITADEYDPEALGAFEGVQWGKIGGSYQIQGNTLVVKLSNDGANSSGLVIADGIRIRRKTAAIIDDWGYGFTQEGGWNNYTGFSMEGRGHDHSAVSTASSVTATATWTFNGVTPGEYEVWTTWYQASNRANNAPYTIKDGSTSRGEIRVDQTKAPNEANSGIYEFFEGTWWRKLGGSYAIDGNQINVALTNDAESGKYVIADAVRIKKVADFVSNTTDSSFSATNVTMNQETGWQQYFNSGFGGEYYVTKGTNSTTTANSVATWDFKNLIPGQYEIWVTWYAWSNRSPVAPYSAYDGLTWRFTNTVNQSQNPNDVSGRESYGGSDWVKLTDIAEIYSGNLVVKLGNNVLDNKYVVADAVRIKRKAALIVDDGDAAFSKTTTGSDQWNHWSKTTNADFGDDHTGLSKSGSSASSVGYVEWQFTGLVNGNYDIYATWVEANNRAGLIKYYANGSSSGMNTVNQKVQPGSGSDYLNLSGQYFKKINNSIINVSGGTLTIRMDTDIAVTSPETYFIADAVHIRRSSLLQSNGGESGNGTVGDNLAGVVPDASVTEAIRRWSETGLSQERIDRLKSVQVTTADFGAGTLGSTDGDTIFIDRDGDSRGWYIDPTPTDDAEFVPGSAITPAGFDLLTVLMHEFGHILGYGDLEPGTGDLMTESIGTGIRRNPNGYVAEPPVEVVTPIPVSRPVSNRSARLLRAVDRLDRRERKFAQLKLRSQAQPARDAAISNALVRVANQRARLLRNMY